MAAEASSERGTASRLNRSTCAYIIVVAAAEAEQTIAQRLEKLLFEELWTRRTRFACIESKVR